jgi:hypothetical protein
MKPRFLAVTFGALAILPDACGSPTAPASIAGTWGPPLYDDPGPIFSRRSHNRVTRSWAQATRSTATATSQVYRAIFG